MTVTVQQEGKPDLVLQCPGQYFQFDPFCPTYLTFRQEEQTFETFSFATVSMSTDLSLDGQIAMVNNAVEHV